MYLYQVTLNQGRTDTVKVKSTSLTSLLSFFNKYSTATVTQVKKVVFSSSKDVYQDLESYRELKALVRVETNNYNFQIRFLKKSISQDYIIKTLKQYLSFNGKKITSVINLMRYK